MTKKPTDKQPDSPLAIASMITGALSLTGPGLILGIPAIILGAVALSKKQPGRNLSIAGIITGAISTVLSIIFIGFMILLFVMAADDPRFQQDFYDGQNYIERELESTRT